MGRGRIRAMLKSAPGGDPAVGDGVLGALLADREEGR